MEPEEKREKKGELKKKGRAGEKKKMSCKGIKSSLE